MVPSGHPHTEFKVGFLLRPRATRIYNAYVPRSIGTIATTVKKLSLGPREQFPWCSPRPSRSRRCLWEQSSISRWRGSCTSWGQLSRAEPGDRRTAEPARGWRAGPTAHLPWSDVGAGAGVMPSLPPSTCSRRESWPWVLRVWELALPITGVEWSLHLVWTAPLIEGAQESHP